MLRKFIPVILLLLLAYVIYFYSFTSPAKQQVKVNMLWHGSPLTCQSTFDPKNKGDAWFIEQLQFFVSEIEVELEENDWQSLALISNAYQSDESVLLGVNCGEEGKQGDPQGSGNWHIEFDNRFDIAKVRSIRFTLGVPFASNHLNPVSQPSPLNLPSMFWVWQTGHKFMRAELASVNEQWLFHLGSTGCKAPSVMRAPQQPCIYPNTFTFDLPVTKDGSKALVMNFNLANLLSNIELTQQSSCQSEHENENCQQLFNNLSVVQQSSEPNDIAVFSMATTDKVTQGSQVE